MKWRLYKRDDPNTWPQIDCPMIVYGKHCGTYPIMQVCNWDKECESFCYESEYFYYRFTECYYAYIGYVPSGYKTLYPTKCMKKGIRCADEDDGYCMFDSPCEFAKEVPEYEIEKKKIWKEFE